MPCMEWLQSNLTPVLPCLVDADLSTQITFYLQALGAWWNMEAVNVMAHAFLAVTSVKLGPSFAVHGWRQAQRVQLKNFKDYLFVGVAVCLVLFTWVSKSLHPESLAHTWNVQCDSVHNVHTRNMLTTKTVICIQPWNWSFCRMLKTKKYSPVQFKVVSKCMGKPICASSFYASSWWSVVWCS